MKFSSLAALEVVILTTFSAASDENFIKMKTFPFQWFKRVKMLNFATRKYSMGINYAIYIEESFSPPLSMSLEVIKWQGCLK